MRVCLEIHLPPPPIRYVRVELGRAEIGVAEHLLNAPEVGAALEQVRRERVPQQVRVDPLRLEAGVRRQPPQDQERAGAGERAALGVEEELRPVPAVEVRAAAGEVAPQRFDRLAADRDDPLLAALADRGRAAGRGRRRPVEADRLADAQARAVEQLDERAVAERARRRPGRGVDQALGLAGRERARQRVVRARQLELRGRVVVGGADQDAGGGRTSGARRSGARSCAGESPSARSSAR